MERKRLLGGCLAAAGMAVLILDSKTALSGAYDAVIMCLRTVIPSLFPFFFLSIWMTNPLIGHKLPPLEPLADLMGMPKGTSSLLVSAFLGGYPAGAQAVAQSYREGCLEKESAERLLSFISNAGPSFIFGMVGQMFSEPWVPWLLWGIHMISAACVSFIIRGDGKAGASITPKESTVSQAMERSLRVMGTVCGWIILFKIIIAFLDRWFLNAAEAPLRIAVMGLLELSNGCCGLNEINDCRLRFVICSGILAMGGLCVAMQTASVAKGLSIKYYLTGKMLQCALSLILASAFMYRLWAVLPALFIPVIIFMVKRKNNSGNPLSVRV